MTNEYIHGWPADGCSCVINQPEGNITIKEDCHVHVLNPRLMQKLKEAERELSSLRDAIRHHLYVCPLPNRNLRANMGFILNGDLAAETPLPPQSEMDLGEFQRMRDIEEYRAYRQGWTEALDEIESSLDGARLKGEKTFRQVENQMRATIERLEAIHADFNRRVLKSSSGGDGAPHMKVKP